jgi:HK97 family phage major capsid protein
VTASSLLPRTSTDGAVRHPLTGEVEFTSSDALLAKHVAAVLDEHDPVTVDDVYEMLHGVPYAQRAGMSWVMSITVFLWLHDVAYGDRLAGSSSLNAGNYASGPELLLGYPAIIDDSVQGLRVRIGAAGHIDQDGDG